MKKFFSVHSLFQSSAAWFFFAVGALLCAAFSVRYFSTALPLLHLDISMNRGQALKAARKLCRDYEFMAEGSYNAAVSFETDTVTQTFVELEGGGKDVFLAMLRDHVYEPCVWHIRHFQEYVVQECSFYFTPTGKPYGFAHILSENDRPGEQLTPDEANKIGVMCAVQWGVDLSLYKLVETSKEVRPNKRMDYSFVYERVDAKLGAEGSYRLQIDVCGGTATMVKHFVKVPESFIRRYQEMRSANNTIAWAAQFFTQIVYIIFGCIFSLYMLHKRRYLVHKKAIFIGLFFGALVVLLRINQFPLLLMHYQTTVSFATFIAQQFVHMLFAFCMQVLLVSIFFASAETMTRFAFGTHVSFFHSLKAEVLTSKTVIGFIIAAYLILPYDFAYVIGFYLFSLNHLGWWMPLGHLYNPNILATYVPFLEPVGRALYAGFVEECLFRAVPLAGAVLLGRLCGREKLFLVSAFIIQIVVFGAAHANYESLPSYARLLELIIPSAIFGGIYLLLGLLPAIIVHVLFDLVLMSLPIFVASGMLAYLNQAMIVLVFFLPILFVVYAYWRRGSVGELAEHAYNGFWQIIDVQRPAYETVDNAARVATAQIVRLPKMLYLFVLLAPVVSFIGTYYFNRVKRHTVVASKNMIARPEALQKAEDYLAKRNIVLDTSWKRLVRFYSGYHGGALDKAHHNYIWQHSPTLYKQLIEQHYLLGPLWQVRYARFEGDVVARAEEYKIFIDVNGNVFEVHHVLPQNRPGASLSVEDARAIAHRAIKDELTIEAGNIKEISATPTQQPARLDWIFVFENTLFDLEQAKARIQVIIMGDEVSHVGAFTYIPEDWLRQQKNRDTIMGIISLLCMFLIGVLFAVAAILSGKDKGITTLPLLASVFLFLVVFGMAVNKTTSHIATFVTSEPFLLQLAKFIATSLLMSAVVAVVVAFAMQTIAKRCVNFSRYRDQKRAEFFGLMAGIGCSFVVMVVNSYVDATSPFWVDLDYMNGWARFAGVAGQYVVNSIVLTVLFITLALLLRLLPQRFSKKVMWLISSILCYVIGIAMVGACFNVGSFAHLCITGMVLGTILNVLYNCFIAADIFMIPITVFGYMLLVTCFPFILFGGIQIMIVPCFAVLGQVIVHHWKAMMHH
jgi:Type II CAAX prenyl endopeptidase Rce1-like